MKIIITEQQYKLLTESNVDTMQHLIDMCVSEIKSNCEKGTYVRGYPVCDQIDTVDEFKVRVANRNLNNLTIWQNVGTDVENGIWAIYGARLGTYMTMLTDWDYMNVQWFDNYPILWQEHKDKDPQREATLLGEALQDKLNLPMCTLDKAQSKFFKRHYMADKHNLGTAFVTV